jgi:enoyl-CoA hydratase
LPATEHLRVELREDGALWLTFDRPEVLNAFSDELSVALAERLEQASHDDAVRCVVLTGAGGSFSAGADISGEDAVERFDVRALDAANRIIRAVTSCAKPVVAAVRGVAAGVGASTALAADLVVAHEDAQLLLAFARIGLMPDGGSSATVAAAIGRPRAMRMALLGEPLTGREAYAAGLVSHLAGADFDEVVADVVRRLTRGAPLAQAATKKAVNAATLHQLEDALERERTGQTILLRTEDAAEGMRAFGERRRPGFRGR